MLYATLMDCIWLRETHLKGHECPSFGSFTLEGKEDCPLVITLYQFSNPLMTDNPVAIFKLDGEDYVRVSK